MDVYVAYVFQIQIIWIDGLLSFGLNFTPEKIAKTIYIIIGKALN